MDLLIREAVKQLKRDNPAALRAFDAMRAAGKSPHDADDELAHAVRACLEEVYRGLPDRLPTVLSALAAGGSTRELFRSG